MDLPQRRWDDDKSGHGVASAIWGVPSARRLLDAMTAPDWVAEDPDVHLLPHLRRACEAPGSPWTLLATEWDGGIYTLALEWCGPEPGMARLRADVFALLGSVAELSTYIHQRVTAVGIEYDMVTGILDGETQFRGHGHGVRLRITGKVVERIVSGTQTRMASS